MSPLLILKNFFSPLFAFSQDVYLPKRFNQKGWVRLTLRVITIKILVVLKKYKRKDVAWSLLKSICALPIASRRQKKDEHIDSNCVNEPLIMALEEIDNEMRHFLSSSSHIKTIHMHCFYGYSDKWTHFIV